MNQRPDLTQMFAAIDGIPKADRNHHPSEDCMGGPVTRYDPAEEAIRPDVMAIMKMPSPKFDVWYESSKASVGHMLLNYRQIARIPDLFIGTGTNTFGVHFCIRNMIETLENADRHLDLIKERRDELRSVL